MSWHAVLITIEQAVIWAAVGGLVARILLHHPLRKLAGLLLVYAIRQARTADLLDTDTPGGLKAVLDAIQENSPPPQTK